MFSFLKLIILEKEENISKLKFTAINTILSHPNYHYFKMSLFILFKENYIYFKSKNEEENKMNEEREDNFWCVLFIRKIGNENFLNSSFFLLFMLFLILLFMFFTSDFDL